MRVKYLWTATIKGRPFAYYRRNGKRTRLPLPTDPAFWPAYSAAHADAEPLARAAAPTRSGPLAGSMAALVIAYRASPRWRELAPATQVSYGRYLNDLTDRYGALPVATMPRAFVFKLQDDFSSRDGKPTPRRANHIVAVLRLLMTWGVDRGWRKDNPVLRSGRLKTGPGYVAWSAADVATFLACPAIGEPMKRALAVGIYTGQRKGDCLAMTHAARADGAIAVVQSKTGARVWIPEHAELSRALDAVPPSAPTLLTRPDGQPWSEDHFAHSFTKAVKAAGLTGLSFHGLRKAAAARLAEAGCSASEIMAITGHRTLGEVTRYVESAEQRSRATAAIGKLTAKGARAKVINAFGASDKLASESR